MTVYLDILFLNNFIMDYIVISITGVLAAVRLSRKRRLASSILGAALAALHFVAARTAAISVPFGLSMPPLIILAALYPCGKQLYLRCLLFYSASAFLASGAAELVLNIIGTEGSGLTSHIIYLTSGILYVLIRNTYTLLKSGAMKGEHKLTVIYGEYSVTLGALLDTGNTLYDPLTKMPVIVADEGILTGLFSKSCNTANITEWLNPPDLRIIPYKTIDKEGVMTGFAPTAVLIDGRPLPDTVIAISPQKIAGGVLLSSAMI